MKKNQGNSYFGDIQDVELAPDDYDDYAAAAAYGVPARYKDVPRPETSFNYGKYVPQDPIYDPYYDDRRIDHDMFGPLDDNRTEQERRYGFVGMPAFHHGNIGNPIYIPEIVYDQQGYPQPTGYARMMPGYLSPDRSTSHFYPRVQFDYRNTNDEDGRREREDRLYNIMRQRMNFD